MQEINKKIGVGVFWSFAGLMLTRGASTVFILFLAKILAPESFGLVAMAAVFFELANTLINSGLGDAIIRSKTVSQVDLDTVFYSNLLLSVLAYTGLFFLSPFIAAFYDQPELTTLIRVMALVVFINACKITQVSVLSREMNFRKQMKANTFGVIISGCLAVAAAWNGFGVWSLVVQMLSASFITVLVLWKSSAWRPTLRFSKKSFKKHFEFGKSLLAEGILNVLYQNSYILVIGKFFSAETTGLYFLASKINNVISRQLSSAVQQPSYPALSTLQDDNEGLLLKYRQIMQLMMFVIAPIMGLIGGLSSVAFDLFFDAQWAKAGLYLQILCFVGVLFPLHALNINLIKIKGRSDLVLKVGILKKIVDVLLLIIALPHGVLAIVIGQVIGSLLSLIPNAYYSNKLVGYSLLSQIKDAMKPLLCAFFAALSSYLFAICSAELGVFELLLSASGGVFVYSVLCFIFKAEGAVIIFRKVSSKAKAA
ncbi:lipopolysaccharide biosynthesis protein [Alcanivorax sp.]|jgi:O-antigen/teichoic acid export membrane protein|uniref:lipopolysaccharide biosynthesis protein n=1 Tax=Alcanivorax sp. TaxID=1872427 RepID=UPI0032D8D087